MGNQLWLLRHGEAEPHGTRPDPERRLTERGQAQSRAAGAALAALGLTFDAVFTSPKVRARQTAELAAQELGAQVIPHEPVAIDFTVQEARVLLAAAEPNGRVLVVGHNPDFAQVVADLTGARVDFKKGGVAGVRLQGAGGELVALLRPRELERISASGH
jgi:phosphohistidine phosphatase